MVNRYIKTLIEYGLKHQLIEESDQIYCINRYLQLFNKNEYNLNVECIDYVDIQELLDLINDYAIKHQLLSDELMIYRDHFDSLVMDVLIPRPSTIINHFNHLYKDNPKSATEYFYQLSTWSNYIRKQRIERNKVWKVNTPYGEIDITINLSKPEKDPKEIALLKQEVSTNYPKCLLCIENEGYYGNVNHPGRSNHRMIPLSLNNEPWYLQYSPYAYYNEHCIVLNKEHIPMEINRNTFIRLLEFVDQFKHYFIGSNADLPIVGGSILSHDHFQGGNYTFAMEQAHDLVTYNYLNVTVSIIHWPLSVLRLRSTSKESLIELSTKILNHWINYSDETVHLKAFTSNTRHNTITPIARYKNGMFEMDLALRNNRTNEEYPDGIFHPHRNLHHIKKENIGLIEVMGLAVLPDRLLKEMNLLKDCLLNNCSIDNFEELIPHRTWYTHIQEKYPFIDENEIDQILEEEIGIVFQQVLEDCGIFKNNEQGIKAFQRFIEELL